jgi:hypothetical protein
MTYRCLDCGHLFESGEEGCSKEYRGEHFGQDCYEKMSCCPLCGGDFDEAKPCKICGFYELEEELTLNHVCNKCIDSYKYDIDSCYDIGKNENQDIELNLFLSIMFSKDDIENILLNELKKQKFVDCSRFIDSDREWFADMILKEVKKG